MPIYQPGHRDRKNRKPKSGKRKVVAMLSLTAMVDMFTVLTIFLLQNYNTTGQVIHIQKDVTLPEARKTKELEPAFVVAVLKDRILLDEEEVVQLSRLNTTAKDWMIEPLAESLKEAFKKEEEELEKGLRNRVKGAVKRIKNPDQEGEKNDRRRVTVQADKDTEFLMIKKVMYTLSEAGAREINFAVEHKKEKEETFSN